jgi:cytochrome c-type biogenesis protein CcmH/NrfG
MIERVALALIALACAAWMAVAFTAARAEDQLRATAVGSTPDVARARTLSEDAARVTPGVRRLILLGQVQLRAGDARAAVATGGEAAGQEPQNAEAWLLIARAAARADPRLAAEAAARVRTLVPPVPAS